MVYLSRMPKSKLRKKVAEARAHNQEVVVETPHGPLESPRWLAPTMVAAFLMGESVGCHVMMLDDGR